MTERGNLPSEEAEVAKAAILRLAGMKCLHGEFAANICHECKSNLLPMLVEQVKTERRLEKRFRAIEQHLGILDEQVEQVRSEFDLAYDAFKTATA